MSRLEGHSRGSGRDRHGAGGTTTLETIERATGEVLSNVLRTRPHDPGSADGTTRGLPVARNRHSGRINGGRREPNRHESAAERHCEKEEEKRYAHVQS